MLSAIPASTTVDQNRQETSKSQKQDFSYQIQLEAQQPTSIATIDYSGIQHDKTFKVLWDTGAQESYISPDVSNLLQDLTRPHTNPIELRLFDGRPTSAGPITHYADFKIRLSPKQESVRLKANVTKLHGADIVLGSLWMAENGIHIDLPNYTVTKGASPPLSLRATSRRKAAFATYPNNIPLSSVSKWNVVENKLPEPTVEDIRQIQVIRALVEELEGSSSDKLASAGIAQLDGDPGEDEEEEMETKELENILPTYCHAYLDIFRQKQGLQTLPPHREYDMRIDLKPSAKLPVSKLYQLPEDQRQALIDILDRETKAGRIRPSNASYGSPMFFVAKKDGRHRMVVDYRRLNENTIPDVYPLPLIDQITNELSEAKHFTKLDLVGAYQLLRMAEGFEHLTSFRTQYGMYESLVVRDGLRNAPAVFQHFLNDVFKEVLGRGVTIYIDDILIYAATLDQLRETTIKVFDIIRKSSLFLKASKCEFEKDSIAFLGFVISSKGIGTDPAKVEAVVTFPIPRCLREARSFLGLVGYYRRFVKKFSEIGEPISNLTKKDRAFVWGSEQQQAFELLKKLMVNAPILLHFHVEWKTILQADASFFGWGFIISQIDPDTGLEHPVAIYSGRFSGAQLNYSTREKEFLAIVEAFRRCRHMLLQVHTTVLTDHLNLKYWMEPRELNPRQARWVEILAPFRIDIVYRPGKQATMPDALSRRADYHPTPEDKSINFAQALPAFATNQTTPNEGDSTNENSNAGAVLRGLQQATTTEPEDLIQFDDIRLGLATDPVVADIRRDMLAVICYRCNHATCKDSRMRSNTLVDLQRKSRNQRLRNPTWSADQLLTFDSLVYIPDHGDMRLKIMRSRHDSPSAGHQGYAKTTDLVSRDYIWFGMNRDVEAYISGCAVCQRTKLSKQGRVGLLKTLEIPLRPWSDISMDFIEPQPKSKGFDSILVIVDRLTKWAIFVPTHTRIGSAKLADLLLEHLVSQHGLPNNIVSDRGSKFTSHLWRYLTTTLGISLQLSTSYHPQTDGQTERVNQVVEQYLRIFTSYKQDDWSTLLPQAAFVYNNSRHATTGVSPFYANFGYHPRWFNELQDGKASESPEGHRIAEDLSALHDYCKDSIAEANRQHSSHYNRGRLAAPEFEIGDQVMLSMKNIGTVRPTTKFDIRHSGPYTVLNRIGSHAYRLKLPDSFKIHDVFHVSLLSAYRQPTYPGQHEEPPGPVEVTDQGAEFEISSIIDSRRHPRTGRLEYLVEWLGYEGTDEQTSWEPQENVAGSTDTIAEFHERYPDKPTTDGEPSRGTTRRRRNIRA